MNERWQAAEPSIDGAEGPAVTDTFAFLALASRWLWATLPDTVLSTSPLWSVGVILRNDPRYWFLSRVQPSFSNPTSRILFDPLIS